MVKIRLQRRGRKNCPFYSVVIADSKSPRDGKFVEKIGTYNPLLKEKVHHKEKMQLNLDRYNYWLSVGAQPTEKVYTYAKLLLKSE